MTSTLETGMVTQAIAGLVRELIDGPGPKGPAFIMNPNDRGLVALLTELDADDAYRTLIPGRASIAGHANHLAFSFQLFNRWARGEENVFESADWAGSWQIGAPSEEGWRRIVRDLEEQGHAWIAAVPAARDWRPMTLTGAISTTAHTAYHLGAIRQLLGALGG